MINLVKCFSKKEGASSVELGLLVALIAAVIVSSVTYLGSAVKGKFESVAEIVNRDVGGGGGNGQPPGHDDDDD